MPGRAYTQLAEVANERYGFVMPDDARGLGVNPMVLVRMAERGQIERRGTGLYRFPLTPASRLDPYMEATLWPRGARGVLSHETALELYELSDVHPAKIHITVPRSHRVRRGVPSAYVLHHEDLKPDQITQYEGIAIVTPVHAIRQAHETSLGAALVAHERARHPRRWRARGVRGASPSYAACSSPPSRSAVSTTLLTYGRSTATSSQGSTRSPTRSTRRRSAASAARSRVRRW